MRWCPSCGADYVDGTAECHRCHVPLVDVPPGEADPFADPRSMARLLEGRRVVPCFAGSPAGIEDLRDALATARIPCAAAPPAVACSSCRPTLHLLVAVEDVERAVRFFADGYEPSLPTEEVLCIAPEAGPDETGPEDTPASCPACGCTDPPGDDGCCPGCGLFLS